MRKNFRTYQIAVKFCNSCKSIKLSRHLGDQLERAAASIVLNLAEGSGRRTKADQAKFFHIAFGSLRECQAVLDLSLSEEHEAVKLADKLAAHLYRLTQAMR